MLEFRPSPRLPLKYALWVGTIVALSLPLALLAVIPELGLGYLAAFMGFTLLWVLPTLALLVPYCGTIRYALDERELTVRMGLLTKTEKSVPYDKVTNVELKRGIWDRLLGLGTLQVHTAGYSQQVNAEATLSGLDEWEAVRQQVFAKYEEAWAEAGELLSSCLNHLAGYRLTLYRHRKWDDVLQEPLEINRMSAETLGVMWDTISKSKDKVVQFLNRKAELLGLNKLAWYDLDAPIGSSQAKLSYDEGAEFIVEQFRKFDPQLAEFAAKALENRWVEAEDRPGKRAGGFCTSFPESNQSRIFMTYSGTLGNVSTLAHELGHAYHQAVMQGVPQLNQRYAMNVAETASTFAEMLVADAAIKNAASPEEQLVLLEDKIQRVVAFFMNIHARFLFETRFYERRKEGLVSVDELNELMVTAQREAYADSLEQYHPYFWASKLHFYITGTPFYNFPYTFGYLFSSGIYARAQAEGPNFVEKYRNLLRDTGRMRVEELAKTHLGVDLTQPDFWQDAVNLALADIDQFLALSK